MDNPIPFGQPDETYVDPRVEFGRALYAATPRLYFTYLILALNVAYFALMCIMGVHWFSPDPQDLIKWGADHSYITPSGQWWRLLTSAFMHAGVLHLAVNMWALWNMGPLTERLFGNIHYLVLYLGCAIVSGLASVRFDINAASVGASGAIFGLFGALLSYIAMQRNSIPSTVAKSLTTPTLTFIGYNIAMGLSAKHISNAAHIGGLLSGLIIGAVMARPLALDPRSKQAALRMISGLIIIAGLTGASIYTLPRPEDSPIAKRVALATRFDNEEEQIETIYEALVQKANKKKITADEFADGVEKTVIPKMDEMASWLTAADIGDSAVNAKIRNLMLDFCKQRKEGFAIYAKGVRTGDEKLKDRGFDLFDGAVKKLNENLNAEMENASK